MQEKINELREAIYSGNVSINFYLARTTKCQSIKDRYDLKFGTFEGSAKNSIIAIMQTFLIDVNRNMGNLRDFWDPDIEQTHYLSLPRKSIDEIDSILNKMNQRRSLSQINRIEKKSDAIIFEILYGDKKRALFFQKYNARKRVSSNIVNYVINSGKFTEVLNSENNLEFNPYFDAIFLENDVDAKEAQTEGDMFLIIRNLNFSRIFGFTEHYEKITKEEFARFSRNKIIIPESVKNEALEKVSFTSKITKLSNAGRINELFLTPDHIGKFLQERDFEFCIRILGEHIHIDNLEALQQLLNILNDNYLKAIVTNNAYIAKSKEKVAH